MDLLLVGCHVLIGVVFAVAAFSKLRSRAALRSFASSPAMLPERFRMPVAGVVASGEAAAAVLMAVPQAGLPLSGLSLCAFGAAITVSIRRGHPVSCRCFGPTASRLGPVHLLRNGLLLAVVGLGLAGLAAGGAPLPAAGPAIAVPAGLIGAVFMIAFDDVVDLFAETSGGL